MPPTHAGGTLESLSDRLSAVFALAHERCTGRTLSDEAVASLQQKLCRGLGVRAQRSLTTYLRHWMRWWHAEKRGGMAGTSAAIEAYIADQETEGTRLTLAGPRVWAIGRVLQTLSWPDPTAEAVVRRVRRTFGYASETKRIQPMVVAPLDWQQLQRIISLANQHSPDEVRLIAALLLCYETMARNDQIFGFKFEGKWIVPPANRDDLRRSRKGGLIHLGPDSRGRGKRSVHLSRLTMAWLERSFLFWPGDGGALFCSAGGEEWTSAQWKHAFRKLIDERRLSYSPSSLRLGRAKDLLQQGAHVLDVQEWGGWNIVGPVLRVIPRSGAAMPVPDCEISIRLPDRLPQSPTDIHTSDLFS